MDRGLIHIYCGDGKGKTTAAVGLAVRAAGRGKNVLMVRFLKNDDSGEVAVLKQIDGITLIPCEKVFGFVFRMNEEEKRQAAAWYGKLFEKAVSMAKTDEYDLFVMDEAMAACTSGMIEEEKLLRFLAEKPEKLEVVMTGRNPSERLMETADYVSEIKAVKHPYEKGIPAREGIEY
ncbi:cob(I)yrinic acid a,c-diamide adenosyltransferase [Clostridium sp. AM58-1XD]|uniref:cob(I)yrinic acid a,c-diamide adenosyltransferase n=1 Tax=Clostridium sp. AM58-1XD TaxID=2292307 RepID=UPI000E477B7F|nr:cob(I)yrinic acid a,c-diamide adenosyltransferase [Clostridium sp. AM58-1XD]RGZ01866.1 cob(I)yrinic acid a,c-diamide adenosyltransferase [Clostridium sp. AM58-1XD]